MLLYESFIFDTLLLVLFLKYNIVESVDILIKELTSTSKYEEINLLYFYVVVWFVQFNLCLI